MWLLRLSKSRKNWAQPNLSRVSRYAPEGATILVPGKLLGSGDVDQRFTHHRRLQRQQRCAREKIEAAGGRIMSLRRADERKPKGIGGCYPWLSATTYVFDADGAHPWPPCQRCLPTFC